MIDGRGLGLRWDSGSRGMPRRRCRGGGEFSIFDFRFSIGIMVMEMANPVSGVGHGCTSGGAVEVALGFLPGGRAAAGEEAEVEGEFPEEEFGEREGEAEKGGGRGELEGAEEDVEGEEEEGEGGGEEERGGDEVEAC